MILIPGDDGYSHAHYWRAESDPRACPRCGLATPIGMCTWPAEPGTPWCNAHTQAWLANAQRAGYVSSAQIRWLCEQTKLTHEHTDALVRRWERFFPPAPAPAAQEPAPVADAPAQAAEAPTVPGVASEPESPAPPVTPAPKKKPRRL